MGNFNCGSWKGITFGEAGATAYEQVGTESLYSVYHVPGGTRVVVQVGGTRRKQYTIQVYCQEATFQNLKSQVGERGTLVYSGGVENNAVLTSVSGRLLHSQRIPASQRVYEVTLQFVFTS